MKTKECGSTGYGEQTGEDFKTHISSTVSVADTIPRLLTGSPSGSTDTVTLMLSGLEQVYETRGLKHVYKTLGLEQVYEVLSLE